jgi:hypothetical protein
MAHCTVVCPWTPVKTASKAGVSNNDSKRKRKKEKEGGGEEARGWFHHIRKMPKEATTGTGEPCTQGHGQKAPDIGC